MTDSSFGLDPVADLAGEFAERYRRGERPSISEYTDRYPDLADQIRDLFPFLVVMEELGSVEGPAPSSGTAPSLGKVPEQLGDFRGAGRPAPGPRHPRQRGRHPRRAEAPARRSTQ